MSFWAELRQRNVFKVGVAYAILAWLLVQIAALVFPQLGLPEWTSTFVTVLLLIGFPVALFLAWAYEVTPTGIMQTKHLPDAARMQPATGQRLNYLVTGALIVAVTFLAIDRFWLASNGSRADGMTSGIGRLAVLPCDNLSPDPNDSYFAAGIHEEIINRLAQIRSLRVTSRSSVIQFTDQRPAIPEIARLLGVDTILECSVRYTADSLLLTAQLIEGESDVHLWSQSYPADIGSDLSELFDIQVAMSVDIANQIRVSFLAEDLESLERVPTESRPAYEAYLAAQSVYATSGEQARTLLTAALAADPTFVDAWLLKASSHLSSAGGLAGAERESQFVLAREAIDQARLFEPDLPDVHVIDAFYHAQTGQWVEAERQARQAIALGAPVSAMPTHGVLKYSVGQFDAGRQIEAENLTVSPLNSVASGFLLAGLEMSGDTDGRRQAYERGEAFFGDWWGDFIEMFLRLGERDTDFLRNVQSDGISDSRVWAATASNIDNPTDGLAAMRDLLATMDDQQRTPRELARLAAWAAYFGDAALGFEAIAEAARLQSNYIWFVWLPAFETVRREPGFEALIDELGLPAYWEEFGYPDNCAWLAGTRYPCS